MFDNDFLKMNIMYFCLYVKLEKVIGHFDFIINPVLCLYSGNKEVGNGNITKH